MKRIKKEQDFLQEKRGKILCGDMNKNISKEVWAVMKGKKQGKTWKKYVDDKIEDISNHIEKQFTVEMNWENYGTFWELDHICPIDHYKHLPVEEAVRMAWKISNLQPLERV